MKYFRSGPTHCEDSGVAVSGTRARKTALISIAAVVAGGIVFGFFFLGTMEENGMDRMPALLVVIAVFLIGVVAAITITYRQLGGGRIRVDMNTGDVELRERICGGCGRTRLKKSEIREVCLENQSTRSGHNFAVSIVSSRGRHLLTALPDRDEAREYATELSSVLSVTLRDGTSE